MEAIVDYRKDEAVAVSMADKHLTTTSGQKRMRKTTVGWKLLVKFPSRATPLQVQKGK
jgi:hypothetical protein